MNIIIPQNINTLIINLSSLSVDNNNIYHSVSSTFFSDNININLENVLKRMEMFNIRKFIIFNIVKDNVFKNKKEMGEYFHSKLAVVQMNTEEFFTKENLKEIFVNNKEELRYMIFIFSGYRWIEIQSRFKLLNINISGGSNSRKHFLSPIEFVLVDFLNCIQESMYSKITESFYSLSEEIRKKYDLTDKNTNRWFEEYKEKKNLESIIEYKKIDNKNNENNPQIINNKNKDNKNNENNPSKNITLYQGKRSYHTVPSHNSFVNIINDDKVSRYYSSKTDNNCLNYLSFIDEILKSNNDDIFKAQMQIENEWMSYMINKLDSSDSKLRRNMSYILKKAKETLILNLSNKQIKKRFPKYYDKLNNNHLLITFSVITTYYSTLSFTSIAMIVSRNIMINIFMSEHKQGNIDKYISFSEFLIQLDMNNNVNNLKLGCFFIEIFCQYPIAVFEKTFKSSQLLDDEKSDDPISILEVNDNYINILEKNIFVQPTSLPMICKPNDWSDSEYGGFLTNRIIKNSPITGSPLHSHKIENKDKLYKTINYLNNIKFKINDKLLTFLENEGKILLLKYFKKLDSKSEILQTKISLKIAKSYSLINSPIYINTMADWRGRIYTQSFFISYQGGDLSSSLLNYYDGESLTEIGKNYLYIYGANCYNEENISKKSYIERINWVNKNYDNIINLDIKFISKAHSVFLFTSFCLTMKDIHKNSNEKVHLPIFLDATCSGIQHLAGILKSYEIGKKVNLIPQKETDEVEDIYSELLGPINEAIHQYGLTNKDCEKFKDIELRREHVKSPIMTKNYNVSVIGIANQLRSSFKKVSESNKNEMYIVPTKDSYVLLNYYQIFTIAQIIDEQIFKSFPALKTIYDYFKNVIRLCLDLNIPAVWFTPTGLKISQHYNITKQNKVSITFGKSSNTVVLREKTKKLDKSKQVLAYIPNIIHSLDASHLMNIINSASSLNLNQIITIHDCFGIHPNNLEQLSNLVKIEFILLYSNYCFLTIYHQRFTQALADNSYNVYIDQSNKEYIKPKNKVIYLPIIPKKGDLDLDKIIHSKYMIT